MILPTCFIIFPEKNSKFPRLQRYTGAPEVPVAALFGGLAADESYEVGRWRGLQCHWTMCFYVFFGVAEGMFQSVPEKGLVIIQLESCISNKKWQEIPEKIGVSSNFSIKPSQWFLQE